MKLRTGRELSQYGGYGVDRHLSHTRSTPAVWWSPSFNSYVVTQRGDSYRIESINGIGEVRWTIDPTNAGWQCDQHAAAAIAYFFEEN